MDKNIFWAFLIIVLVLGLTAGLSISGFAAKNLAFAVTDTDGGDDIAVAGECITQGGTVYTDTCIGVNLNTVKEYYISTFKYCAAKSVNCVIAGYSRCFEGACVPGPEATSYIPPITDTCN